jgi:hypothetical protein
VKKVSRFIYATWNIRGLGEKEEELDKILNENNVKIDNEIIEQVNSFNYLGNILFYGKDLDIDNKLHNYLKITGILNNVFRPQKLLRKQ